MHPIKILWLSEAPFIGKYPRDFENCRTEIAWMIASGGEHQNIGELPNIPDNSYDIAIIILPKREDLLMRMSTYAGFDLIGHMRRVAKHIGHMQEGHVKYFQDYSVAIQTWWYSVLDSLDFLMVHNEIDQPYISGLFNKPTFVNRSLMIEDEIKLKNVKRKGVIIGGNLVGWYSGFDSFMIATRFNEEIYAPSMGRKPKDEDQLSGLNHLPYMTWLKWINNLSQYKYAVHLMPTIAAGTFSLNCAYMGIPTLGNRLIDSQRICFPDLSVSIYDIGRAVEIADKLLFDKDFYDNVSAFATQQYQKEYSENVWKERFNLFLKSNVL